MKYGAVITLTTLVCMVAGCTREYKPICGSDGRTYSNPCLFRKAKEANPALSFASQGRCNYRGTRDVAIQIADEKGSPYNITIKINDTSSQETNSTESSEEDNENIEIKINDITYYNKVANKTHDVRNKTELDAKGRDKRAIACNRCNGKCLPICRYFTPRSINPKVKTVDITNVRKKRSPSKCSDCPRNSECERQCLLIQIRNPIIRDVRNVSPQLEVHDNEKLLRDKRLVQCREDDEKCLKDFNRKPAEVYRLQARQKRAYPNCVCPYIFKQVCGTNGVTYANECLLKCAAKSNSRILKQHEGPCGNRRAREVRHGVIEAGKEEITKTQEEVEIEHKDVQIEKKLKDDVIFDFIPDEKLTADSIDKIQVRHKRESLVCPCHRNFDPICATNGVTYNNECLLKCAAKRNGRILKQHKGPCRKYRWKRAAIVDIKEAGKEFDDEIKMIEEVKEYKDVKKPKEDLTFDFIPE